MRKMCWLLVTASCLMSSCLSDPTERLTEGEIISGETDMNSYQSIVLSLNVKTADNAYLVVESLEDVELYINDTHWTTLSTQPINITDINKYEQDNMLLTNDKVNYVFVANQQLDKELEYTTTGDIIDYMNAIRTLDAGEYMFTVKSFKVTFTDNTTRTFYPEFQKVFTVGYDRKSSLYLGEVELKIN